MSVVYWEKQKERIIGQFEEIINPGTGKETIRRIDEYFGSIIKVKNFTGSGNEELKYDQSFEKNCIILSQYSNKPVKNCTTKEYFTLIEYYNYLVKQQRRGTANKTQ